MRKLLGEIEKLKESSVKSLVDSRIGEFSKNKDLFSELCFCLLTANFNAERSIRIQKEVGDGFSKLSKTKLAKKLKELGHRFPNARAGYIVEARKHKLIADREWLVNNVNGLGYKEASHFLRNIGNEDSAIIDFHIIDLLVKHNLIKRPKSLTKVVYLQIEDLLRSISQKVDLNLAELDLYLWYLEAGKVLK
ncbi:MAG: N-glycosylase/DNA lyase [archaeon]